MELGRINIDYMKQVTNSLLCKVVNINLENGGYTGFTLFKECTVSVDEKQEWYIEIEAHDKALPLMFEFKEKYFTYQLWNALRLKSSNQLRMYEILKQYEKIGARILSIDELKNLLGIEAKEYPRFDNFKSRVLESCREALKENTDIKFTYEPYGKKGKGGKILNLKFIIKKNKKYIDQITLDEFIEQKQEKEPEGFESRLNFFAEACDNEFTLAEMQVIYDILINSLPFDFLKNEIDIYNYIKKKYDELKWRAEKTHIRKRFNYFKSILEAEDKN